MVAHQAPLSMEFSGQQYWRGLPFSSPEDLPNPGMEPGLPALQVDSLFSESPGKSLQSVLCRMQNYCFLSVLRINWFKRTSHMQQGLVPDQCKRYKSDSLFGCSQLLFRVP